MAQEKMDTSAKAQEKMEPLAWLLRVRIVQLFVSTFSMRSVSSKSESRSSAVGYAIAFCGTNSIEHVALL